MIGKTQLLWTQIGGAGPWCWGPHLATAVAFWQPALTHLKSSYRQICLPPHTHSNLKATLCSKDGFLCRSIVFLADCSAGRGGLWPWSSQADSILSPARQGISFACLRGFPRQNPDSESWGHWQEALRHLPSQGASLDLHSEFWPLSLGDAWVRPLWLCAQSCLALLQPHGL